MFQIIIILILVTILISSCANENFKPLTFEYLCFINVITFLIYGWDKLAAMIGWWRTMEFTLHILSVLGGWPAALITQHLFGHETRENRFQIIFWLIVAIHIIGIYFLLQQFPSSRRHAY